jgi:hypothetical protein
MSTFFLFFFKNFLHHILFFCWTQVITLQFQSTLLNFSQSYKLHTHIRTYLKMPKIFMWLNGNKKVREIIYYYSRTFIVCIIFNNLHFFLFVYLPKEKHTSKNVTQLRIISNSILFSFELIHSIFSLLLH